MTGFLTTHVLDTSRGCPASGLRIELFRLDRGSASLIRKIVTNSDGRADGPILTRNEFQPGTYELVFHAGEYFNELEIAVDTPRFLESIPIRFGMSANEHYHVPLLLSPYGYSTYRGS